MLEITNLRNGAVLNRNHGVENDEYLEFELQGLADPQALVRINDTPAERDDRRFHGKVRLSAKLNEIIVSADSQFGESRQRLTVAWDKKSFKRYQYYIDDCIFFYTDIARTRPKSLFDHFFLKRLRDIHRKYGTKFTLNSFYRNDHFPFELKDFPDTYRQEWQDHSDWLRLSFHAYSEFPDRPYQRCRPEKFFADYDLLKTEICRFAGESVFIRPPVIHWAMANPEIFEGLRQRGLHYLGGSFIGSKTYVGEPDQRFRVCDIGYFYEKDVVLYLEKHKLFYDKFTGMFLGFDEGSLCANMFPLEILRERMKYFADCETLSMGTHEQYSFDYYPNYIPDHFERIECCCRCATEAGYQPVNFGEDFLGNPAWGD